MSECHISFFFQCLCKTGRQAVQDYRHFAPVFYPESIPKRKRKRNWSKIRAKTQHKEKKGRNRSERANDRQLSENELIGTVHSWCVYLVASDIPSSPSCLPDRIFQRRQRLPPRRSLRVAQGARPRGSRGWSGRLGSLGRSWGMMAPRLPLLCMPWMEMARIGWDELRGRKRGVRRDRGCCDLTNLVNAHASQYLRSQRQRRGKKQERLRNATAHVCLLATEKLGSRSSTPTISPPLLLYRFFMLDQQLHKVQLTGCRGET